MPLPDYADAAMNYLFRTEEGPSPRETYGIIDAARDDRIYPKIATLDPRQQCLYRGDKGVELARVAPYLIPLNRQDFFTDWLLLHGWGRSWGIFLRSSASFGELHRHFRKFLMVHDEKGMPLYFRFYDPRVFRVYLPTCNASELQTLFGSVDRFLLEGKDKTQLLEFSCSKNFELSRKIIRLTQEKGGV